LIFVDTWAWLALAHKHDPYHAVAAQQHRALQQQKARYVTSDFVLAETITPLFAVLNFAQAEQFMRTVFQAIQSGRYVLEHVGAARFEAAWRMRLKYHDKPDISFVDFTSMVIMQELGISEVFTGDQDFRQVGLGFRLVPWSVAVPLFLAAPRAKIGFAEDRESWGRLKPMSAIRQARATLDDLYRTPEKAELIGLGFPDLDTEYCSRTIQLWRLLNRTAW
jgi:uncharacterized protein